MSYNDLSSHLPQVTVQTETESVQLDPQAGYAWRDIRVELVREADRLRVYLTAENTPVCRVWLTWDGGVSAHARILGDAWERGYGDLEWRGVVPERILPWYVIAAENDGVSCYGVETGAGGL